MRRLRAEGWSYRKIAGHCGLSPERTTQLLQRDRMVARTYGPWVVFNDIAFLVMCRPNREAARRKYMQTYKPPPTIKDEMTFFWRCMIVQYRREKGLGDG